MIEAARLGVYVSAEGVDETRKKVGGLGDTLSSVAGKAMVTGGVMTAAVTGPLLMMGKQAVDTAKDFDVQMRNIQSISKDTDVGMKILGDAFLSMSQDITQTTNTATELAAGFYQIQSSGFAGANAMEVLQAASKAATAGLTTTDVSAKAITAALNAYGMSASEAGHVSDVLFKTVDIGVVTFNELASQLGDVVGTANVAGVSIEEIGAATATMTKGGISAAETMTSLNQLMLSFIAPAKEARTAAKELGIDLSASALESKGLAGVMAEVQKATGGSVEAMAALFPNVRALRGALSLTRGEMKPFEQDLLAMAGASGATQAAFGIQVQSFEAQWQNFKNVMDGLKIGIATILLPMLNNLVSSFIPLIQKFQELNPSAQGLVVVFGVIAAAIGPLLLILGSLATAITAIGLPILAVVASIGLLAAAFATNFGGIRDVVMGAITPVLTVLKTLWDYFKFTAQEGDYLNDSLIDIPESIRPVAEAFGRIVGAVGEAIQTFQYLRSEGIPVFDALKGALTDAASDFDFIAPAIERFKEAWAQLVAFFEPTIQRIRDAVGPMIESFSPLGDKLKALWDAAEPILSTLAQVVGVVVVAAFNLLLEIVAAVMPSIGTIIGNAIDIATTVLTALGTIVEEVVALVKAAIEGDWTAVWEHAQVILETLWNAVETIFGEILDTIKIVIGDILVAITNWLGNLNTEWGKRFGELVTAAKAKMLEIYNTIKTQLASIVDAVKSFSLRDAGAALIDGMIEGIKAKAGALVSAAQGVVQNAVNAAKALLGIHSPSTVFLEIGRNIMAGLVAGIDQETPASVVAMSDAMSAIVDAVGKVLGIFGSLDSMTVIGDVGGKMATFRDQVKSIIIELKTLAEYYGSPEAQSAHVSAKAVLEFIVPLFDNMQAVMDAIQTFADLKPIADAKAQMDKVVAGIRAMISGVAAVAAGPEMAQLTTATEAGLNLSLFAAAVEGIFGPLREAAKAWETIKNFDFTNMKVEPVLRWLASFGSMAVQAVEWARSWGGTAGEGMGAFITGVGQAVKSLADVAKAWETIQGFNWSALDANAVVKWLASLGGLAVQAMKWAGSWATPGVGLDAFATAVKTSLGGLVEVAKAWEVLQGFKWNAGLDMKKITDWLAALGGLAVTALENVAAWKQFETIDAKVKELAAYMQSAFGALSAAVQFTNELDGWKDLPDLEGKFDRLRRAIEYIVPQFELTRKAIGVLAYEEVAKFAQALADVASGIQAALSLMQTDMSDLDVPDASFWEPLNDWIKATMTSFSDWLAANPNLTQQSPMVTAFGQAVGGLFGGLRSAIEVAAMLPKDWAAPSDAVWIPFTDWVKATFESFYDYVTQEVLGYKGTKPEPKFTPGGLDLVSRFGTALSGLMGGLKSAVELAINLPASWTAPDAGAWASFTSWVQKVFDSFLAWVTKTHTDANGNQIPFDTVGLDLVTKFGSALSSLMSGLGASFAVFSGLVGFVAPSEAQFTAFKTAVQKVFSDFATYAKTTLVVAANDAVKAFGEAMSALFSGLNTALTFTSAVYKEAPGFFAFLASAAAGAGGDFQVKMGLIMYAITETMTRFKANVVDKVKTDWLPAANTLLSAVQSVFGVLNQALNIFKDLNTVGMPSSSTITSFVDAVIGLFNKLTTGLGLTNTQVGATGRSVGEQLDYWQGEYYKDAERWYYTGYAFGQFLAQGWQASMIAQQQAGSFMLSSTIAVTDAIKQAIKTAFGIHSPSTVMAGYGQQMAMGLGIGMQKGMTALGLPGLNGQPLQMAYAGLPTQTVRVQVGGDISIGGQRVTPEMADEIAYLLTQRLRLRA